MERKLRQAGLIDTGDVGASWNREALRAAQARALVVGSTMAASIIRAHGRFYQPDREYMLPLGIYLIVHWDLGDGGDSCLMLFADGDEAILDMALDWVWFDQEGGRLYASESSEEWLASRWMRYSRRCQWCWPGSRSPMGSHKAPRVPRRPCALPRGPAAACL